MFGLTYEKPAPTTYIALGVDVNIYDLQHSE